MQAYPDKFQAIAVGRKTKKKNPVFNIAQSSIEREDIVKLLGIDIDFTLNFDAHLRTICKKAAQQLNILKKNWKKSV